MQQEEGNKLSMQGSAAEEGEAKAISTPSKVNLGTSKHCRGWDQDDTQDGKSREARIEGERKRHLEGMARLASHEMQRALQHGARVPEGPPAPAVGDGNVEQLGRRRRRWRLLRHVPYL